MPLTVLPGVDFSRAAVLPTVKAVAAAIREYFDKGAAGFNYAPYYQAQANYLAGKCTVEQAQKDCESHGAPAGRQQNAEVAALALPFQSGRVGLGRKLVRDSYAFRRDLRVPTGQVVLAREGVRPVLMVTQPRKVWAMDDPAWRLHATLIKRTYASDDSAFLFDEDVDPLVEIIDVSAPNKVKRVIQTRVYSAAELLDEHGIAEVLQRYAEAHDLLTADGFSPERRRRPRKPDHPDLFDDRGGGPKS